MKRFLYRKIFLKAAPVFLYGLMVAVLVFALKWMQWKFLITDHAIGIYIGLIAVFFTILGVWVATQVIRSKTRTVVVEKKVYIHPPEAFQMSEEELKRLNLSRREFEVLQLLARGCSNAEIAEELFLSISTVKTHVSSLFVKLDVKSRTQTIDKARRLKIIA